MEQCGKQSANGWNSLFAGSKLAAKGESLSFISPVVVNGKAQARLSQAAVEVENAKWEAFAIVYVIGDTPTIATMGRYVEKEWNFVSKPTIFLHDEGYFLIRFVSKEDRDEVFFSGPHSFYGVPTVVKKWEADFDIQKQALKVVPLWVQFPNLPLNCWGGDTLSRLGSLLGVPLYADECTNQQLRISFARILVEVDVTKQLSQEVLVEDPHGQTFVQKKDVTLTTRTTEMNVGSRNDNVVAVEITPATKHQQASSDDDGGWKVVTKKTKEKGKRIMAPPITENAYYVL
ncbi:Chlorophenol O-methyltransferase [Bienertia sinuspersici]